MKNSGIYRIESIKKPERFYIGSGVNLQNRKDVHFSNLKLNKHGNSKLQNHYNKYGKEDLVFVIIEPCFSEFLLIREQYYLDKLKPWFNICKIAGNSLGTKRTEESKQKMSESRKGKSSWNKGVKGKKHTEATKQKMSETRKGRKLSEQAKINISNGRKGIIFSEEHKQKISEAGKKRAPITEETRQKLSELHKGKKHSEETKVRMRQPKSEEHREKIRLSWIKRKQN